MKKNLPLIAIILLITSTFSAQAQSGFDQLIKSSPADATKLIDAYAEPLFKGFGTGMNTGWTNNTAKTKKLLHFDIRISATAALIPQGDKTFDVTQIGLSNHIRPDNPNQTIAPTFAGDKNDGPQLDIYDDNGKRVGSFTTPKGQISIIPTPQIQATFGIIKNTDVTIRGIPKITFGGDQPGNVSMIGFGIKHDIIQDFAGTTADKLIPFDLSVALGYNHFVFDKKLNVQPDNGAVPADNQQSNDFSNQHVNGKFNSFTGQVIISKKLAVFTPFLAVGYQTASTDFGALGNYPVTTDQTALGTPVYKTFTNPVNINETSISGVRADVGFQLALGFFRLYASYSAGQYSAVNGGIGFGW